MFPVLFRIGGIDIYAYGVMLAIAFGLGTYLFVREGRNAGYPEDRLLDLVIWIMIASIVGSRLLYILIELPVYLKDPSEVFRIRSGGLSFHGGLFAGIAAGLLHAHRNHLPKGKIADLVAPYLALGYAITRIGCLLNGCCYGRASHLPWALRSSFPDDTLRHPTQLYAFLAVIVIFFILHWRKKHTRFAGQLFLEFIMLYSIYRFIVEFFRETTAFLGFLTLGQAISLVGAVAAFVIIRVWPTGRRGRK